MRILWLCNIRFSDDPIKGTGSWLQPLAQAINNIEGYEVVNVTIGRTTNIIHERCCSMIQYILPNKKHLYNKNKWLKETGNELTHLINEEKPDLVHIWGTESYWALLHRMGYIRCRVVLDMQGVCSETSRNYKADLGFLDLKKELPFIKAIFTYIKWQKDYKKSIKGSKEEYNIIRSFKYISVQSEWVSRHIHFYNPTAIVLKTRIVLRAPFYNQCVWEWHECGDKPIVFTSLSASSIYKGLHILLQSISLLKNRFPNIELRIAGNVFTKNRMGIPGYSVYLLGLIKSLDLENNVVFLGSLDANQIVEQLLEANVCVIPSFVESYCLGFAEALMVGTPTVAAYSGALPDIAKDKKETLFYNPRDYISSAAFIEQIISDKNLSMMLSSNARAQRLIDNDLQKVLTGQIDIYDTILKDN